MQTPSTTISMPQLGESVTEGTVGNWLKQVGERVEKYEPLVEVTTGLFGLGRGCTRARVRRLPRWRPGRCPSSARSPATPSC